MRLNLRSFTELNDVKNLFSPQASLLACRSLLFLENSYLWFTFLLKGTGLFDLADRGDHLKHFLEPFKSVHLKKGGLFPPGVYFRVSSTRWECEDRAREKALSYKTPSCFIILKRPKELF